MRCWRPRAAAGSVTLRRRCIPGALPEVWRQSAHFASFCDIASALSAATHSPTSVRGDVGLATSVHRALQPWLAGSQQCERAHCRCGDLWRRPGGRSARRRPRCAAPPRCLLRLLPACLPLQHGRPLPACLLLPTAAEPLTSSLRVVLLDPRPPAAVPRELPPVPDSRVAALNPASVDLLRSVGAWRTLAPAAAPFCDMQVLPGWAVGGWRWVPAAACCSPTQAIPRLCRCGTAAAAAATCAAMPPAWAPTSWVRPAGMGWEEEWEEWAHWTHSLEQCWWSLL